MTNNQLTDERIEQIAVWLATESHSLNLEMLTCLRELQERRKADSESVTVTDDMAYAFHHALTDSMLGADDVEEIKTGLRAVFANLTAPIVSAEYPERLPCSVLLEPGLRFGKGIKTSTILAALARRAVYESDMAALTPEEKAEFREKIADFKALIAQPAPVVLDIDELRLAFEAAERESDDGFNLHKYGIGYADDETQGRWDTWLTCRAAMLQAGNSPAHSGLRPEQSGVSPAQNQGWIPVSERMPARGDYLVTDGSDFDVQTFDGEQFIPGFVWEDKITHWMPLPAAPQEVNHG